MPEAQYVAALERAADRLSEQAEGVLQQVEGARTDRARVEEAERLLAKLAPRPRKRPPRRRQR